jgi:cysteinyl-tRNA synthetase
MKLFNTMTMKKEEFVPIEEGKVKMYACGPTVYNFIHVGNARPIIMFDVLRRYLEYRGYDVTFVQNFTDVDDKIIKRANEEGITSEQVAAKYIGEYFTDAKGLGVRPATIHPKATENIRQIIDMVQTLVDKGFAYEVNGDVYYRTTKFSDYGKLSHQPLEELQAGARIDVSDVKENPMDFALWKAAKPGEPYWESPWGNGRPGWHIECSAMSNRYLGKTIDIHCGGQDLTFPHHENEIAQSEAANGCKFVNYWVHNGFISIDNRKMSKSLGNFFTVREAAEAYGYPTIRMFMLMSHYRSPLNYSGEILIQAQNALERLKTAHTNLKFLMENGAEGDMTPEEQKFADSLDTYRQRFDEDRDANTVTGGSPTKAVAKAAFDVLDELQGVLGLIYGEENEDEKLAEEVEALIQARQQARKDKNWAEADRIRDQLKDMGIVLMDTKQGVQWKKA